MTDRIKALENITDPDFIFDALDDVHDAETTLDDYAEAVSRAQRAALAASQPAPDCYQPELVAAELHRSFPDAGDGRPMPPMGDDLMTAGLSADDARFVAVQLAQNGLMLVAAQPAQPVAVKVKPLVWTKSAAATPFGNYIVTCEEHDDRTVWFVMFGGKILPKCGEHDSEASAKAAVQADYEARIMAELDVQPLTVQDAARVPEIAALIEGVAGLKRIVEEIDGAMLHGDWRDKNGNRLKDTPEWVALYNAMTSLRAIAEGK